MKNFLIFEQSLWFVLVCVLLALIYTFFLYFRDKKLKDITKVKLYTLVTLRFFSVLIISLLLLSPLFKSITTKIQKPIIIYAVDNSKSIKLAYQNNSKIDELNQLLSDVSSNISKKFDVRNFSFDKTIYDTLNFEFDGKNTDISNLMTQINNKFYNQNIGALIIASDGIYNSGTNPIYSTDKLDYAIYTIGLGDTTIFKDAYVKDLRHNQIAFLNNQFPVEITIGAKKLNGEIVTLKIFNNGKLVFTENVNITSNDFLSKVNLHLKAEKEGVQQYQIKISTTKKERNIINNRRNFAVKIMKNKQKILVLANSPHPDLSAIKNSLKTNSNFEVDVKFASNFSQDISDYSLIIFHNLPSSNYKLASLFEKMKKIKVPMMIIVGMQTNIALFNSQNLGLKITQSKGIYDDVQAYLSPEFKDFEISQEFNDLLKFAPPMKVPFVKFSFIPQIKVVLNQRVKGIDTQNPLLLISNGSDKYESNIVFILGENFWRLRLFDYRNNQNFELFDEFLQNLAQYAVLKSKTSKFIVKVEKIIAQNDEIIFNAEVYDKIFQLVNKNDVSLVLSDSIGNKYNYIFDKTTNAYKLNVGNFSAGNYNYIAKTEFDSEKLVAKGSFVVIPVDEESQDLVANHYLLRKISALTGGKFFSPTNLDSLKQTY